VTHLRKVMLEELHRRNLSAITTRIFLHSIEEFALYYKTPPDRLGLEHVRQYQAHLFTDRKLEAVSVARNCPPCGCFFSRPSSSLISIPPFSCPNFAFPPRSAPANQSPIKPTDH
jgi:hypothetical protein